jgi:subtilisin family serine protease
MLKQPGHGTGTYGILAGGKVSLQTHDGEFNDFLGGAYFADIIPCRISATVILFKTSAYAEALDYLTQLSLNGTQVHVASMSMGGAPSRIWADAVNAAYDAGIILVSAAGNNFAGLPTRHVVYPARFKRVITACGVTFDYKPYYTSKINEMQGCFGPKRHMQKALAAFTPNMPWASVESGTIRFSGAGTSSATPQVAAAAAIYYRKHHAALDRLKPWERVEAVRYALFGSARKTSGIARFDDDFTTYFGNGIIQAMDALDIPVNNNLTKTPEDEVPWFPVLNTIFKTIPSAQEQKKLQMFNTELAQLVFADAALAALVDESRDYDKISKRSWKKFADAVIAHPGASVTLKKYLQQKNRP